MLNALALCAALVTSPSWVSFTIKDSLEVSIVRVVPAEGPALSAEVARLLRWRGDVNRNVHRGDTLQLLYQPGQTEPDLLALVFTGAQINLRAYRYTGADGIARYYDQHGVLVEPQLLNTPVPAYAQITETVQAGRGKRRHHGIDLKAAEGSPIRLPFSGSVLRTNWAQRVNGHCIEVAFDNGKVGRFLHLLRLDPGVRPGAHLAVGAPLGLVGNTGHSNAAHLHYEILVAGKPVEPLDVHGRRTARLGEDALAAFSTQRDALDRALVGPAAVPQLNGAGSAVTSVSSSIPPPLPATAAECVPVSTDVQKPLGCKP